MAKRTGTLGNLSLSDLQSELRRRQRRVGVLIRARERFAKKIAALNTEISNLGGVGGAGGTGRTLPKNDTNLVDAIIKTLGNKTMGVSELTEAVQKGGYQTTSPSFRVIVNQTLINHKDKFKRVDRGQYAVK